MGSLRQQIEGRLRSAVGRVAGTAELSTDPQLREAAEERFGDFQSNCAMGLAKALGKKPRDVAQAIVDAAELDDLCEPLEVAGPGFINIRLRPAAVAGALRAIQADPRLGIAVRQDLPHAAVDFSSPNLAKEMHVGHLRSTIIGDAICRTLEFLGHEVERINHVGDWGTQFGMLIEYVRRSQPQALADPASFVVGDLEGFYKQAKDQFDSDAAFADAARRAVVDLQSGQSSARGLWQAFCTESLRHCDRIYERLGVRLTHRGESFYNDMLGQIVAELRDKNVLVEDQGAHCVFLEGFTSKTGRPLPMIVQKSDGGYNYETTDLAALRHRIQALSAKWLIYVTDSRQRQHFEMLFAAARRAGWAGDDVRLQHVGFGMMLGKTRRPFRTRAGETIPLADLLDEAEQRARAIVDANSPHLPAEHREQIARAVGIGSVKYADLVHNLASDYVFDWDKMLAMEGNTAPYMMYAYARVQAIGRKGAIEFASLAPDVAVVVDHPLELALAKKLLAFGDYVEWVAQDLAPHLLTQYLFDLAQAYSKFYTNCPVLKAGTEALRLSRLRLCDLTARTLKLGLHLLGIEVVAQM